MDRDVLLYGEVAERLREHRLADTDRTHEQDVVVVSDEAHGAELVEEVPIVGDVGRGVPGVKHQLGVEAGSESTRREPLAPVVPENPIRRAVARLLEIRYEVRRR